MDQLKVSLIVKDPHLSPHFVARLYAEHSNNARLAFETKWDLN